MRLYPAAVILFFYSIGAIAQSPQSPKSTQTTKLSQIANGVFAGNTYTNDDLGMTFLLPKDWTATVNPKMPMLFSPDADDLANQCTRILLQYDSKPGDSRAKGVAFAIDPDCLKIGPFPGADAGKDELEGFNQKIFEIYQRSTFFPPSGVQLYAFKGTGEKGRLFLGLSGTAQVRPPGSDPAVRSEPVLMNTLFVVVDVDKCWVGWAIVADDKAKDEFAKDSRMTVK